MVFPNEAEAVQKLSDTVLRAGANLFKATKYLYALSADSFYQCDVKDFIKVILNNMFHAESLSAFHLTIDDSTCGILNTREYFDVFRLIIYSFAVRLPVLCNVKIGDSRMTDKQIRAVYDAVIERGISNKGGVIAESFDQLMTAVKKGKSVEAYGAEWFKSYLYSSIPELADISNRNLFFIGAAEVLLVLYYLCLEKEFDSRIHTLFADERFS
jgi:hypothetical protein